MPETILDKLPAKIIAGTTVNWTTSLSDYPASDGWLLQHVFVIDGDQVIVPASAYETDNYLTELDAATSALMTVGTYRYQAIVTLGSEVYDTGLSGRVEVLAGYIDQTTGYDGRTWLEIALERVRAAIQDRATHTELSFTINTGEESRSLSMMDLGELEDLERRLAGRLRQIENQERVDRGLETEDTIYTRFTG